MEKKIEERLITVAARLAKPYLNREVPTPATLTRSDRGLEVLWDHGFVPAREVLLSEALPAEQVDEQLARVKALLEIVEPGDLVTLPEELLHDLRNDLKTEVDKESAQGPQSLLEHVISEITEFRVEMWSNESRHAGRPHVRVHLKSAPISVSLDDPPVNLTPNGRLIGEAAALKVIKKHRDRLLEIWHSTRPDTQVLHKGPTVAH